jgi:hypothetical protein
VGLTIKNDLITTRGGCFPERDTMLQTRPTFDPSIPVGLLPLNRDHSFYFFKKFLFDFVTSSSV